ncbi:hypothetical protein Micbo1qcDRAFT_176371 [Microdochium bolleyi]|uniref:Uncharacterized protein n=1 Tax=Microdochium bolleyi TaxID=196109 RepID=A0A136J0M4_9PEZI|nr:hypothetical protein Micbo1qcDRAFT_176371 [Microdochium bolleyi]
MLVGWAEHAEQGDQDAHARSDHAARLEERARPHDAEYDDLWPSTTPSQARRGQSPGWYQSAHRAGGGCCCDRALPNALPTDVVDDGDPILASRFKRGERHVLSQRDTLSSRQESAGDRQATKLGRGVRGPASWSTGTREADGPKSGGGSSRICYASVEPPSQSAPAGQEIEQEAEAEHLRVRLQMVPCSLLLLLLLGRMREQDGLPG